MYNSTTTITEDHNTNKGSSSAHHSLVSVYTILFTLLIAAALVLQHLVNHVWKPKYLSECGATMLLGMAVSAIIFVSGGYDIDNAAGAQEGMTGTDDQAEWSLPTEFRASAFGFSATIFYFGFLPPIIFNSGYHLKRIFFYSNFLAALALSILGTVVSVVITSFGLSCLQHFRICGSSLDGFSWMEIVAFAALISSTDPVATLAVFSKLRVDPSLFYLVFGESILNDAIAVTVFRVACSYIGVDYPHLNMWELVGNFILMFIGSCVIGYLFGIFTAVVYKYVNFADNPISGVTVIVLLIYVPYMLCEFIQFSGIVSILFAGIAVRRYTNKNMSLKCKTMSSFLFNLLSNLADNACFCLLGLSVFSQSIQMFRADLIGFTLLFCLVSRAMHVYPLLTLVNVYRRLQHRKQDYECIKIDKPTMHVVFFAGLRGAVAFACANIFPNTNHNRALVVSTTTAIIIVTIFVQGGFTQSFIEFLGMKTQVNPAGYLSMLRTVREHRQEDNRSCASAPSTADFEERYLYPCIIRNNQGSNIRYDTDTPEIQSSNAGRITTDGIQLASRSQSFKESWMRLVGLKQYSSKFTHRVVESSGGGTIVSQQQTPRGSDAPYSPAAASLPDRSPQLLTPRLLNPLGLPSADGPTNADVVRNPFGTMGDASSSDWLEQQSLIKNQKKKLLRKSKHNINNAGLLYADLPVPALTDELNHDATTAVTVTHMIDVVVVNTTSDSMPPSMSSTVTASTSVPPVAIVAVAGVSTTTPLRPQPSLRSFSTDQPINNDFNASPALPKYTHEELEDVEEYGEQQSLLTVENVSKHKDKDINPGIPATNSYTNRKDGSTTAIAFSNPAAATTFQCVNINEYPLSDDDNELGEPLQAAQRLLLSPTLTARSDHDDLDLWSH